jgi:hypothetical protein
MKFLAVLFFTLFLFGFNAQLKREVLFRLQPNEVLFQNEYTVMIALDGTKKFSALIKDTLTNNYRLVFNGNTVGRFTGTTGWPLANIQSIDLNKPNGYSYITYRGKQLGDINIEGKKINNLENASFVASGSHNNQNNDYYYRLLGERYLNKNGKSFSIQDKINYQIHGSDIFWIKGWDKVSGHKVYWNSNFLGTFHLKWCKGMIDENGYAFCYRQNDVCYINFNGSVSRISSDCRSWHDCKIVGNDYYFIIDTDIYKNDTLVHTFNNNISDWDVNSKGDILYTDGENLYLNSLLVEQNHGATFIRNLSVDNSGNISYTYDSKECSHCYFEVINQNEKEYTSYRIWGGAEIGSTDGEHHLKSKWNYDYVVIDGAPYGSSPALTAWFDEKKKCFYWNSFEKNELVFYQFIP